MKFFTKWKSWAKTLKLQSHALYLAYRDPRVPWYAKAFGALVVAYAFSPIDLIPDFIPILGYLDDLILIPLGISIALKMIPEEIMEECKIKAANALKKQKNWVPGIVIIATWIILFLIMTLAILKCIRSR